MREIAAIKVAEACANLCKEASYLLADGVEDALNHTLSIEESEIGREIIREIIKNAEIAKKEKMPICQDTGIAIFFLEIGQEVKIVNGDINGAVNEGVIEGYKNLRKSVVSDPLIRKNSNDNTPAIIHTKIVSGDKIKIGFLPKGGGAENSSTIKMFLPTSSKEDIIKFIVGHIEAVGAKSCPPLILGIGIGGTFDHCAYLAKKALTRRVCQNHSSHHIAEFEKEMLKEINKTGVGPMGLGGRVTALAVHIETYPCHIASLPVAVNVECHAHRYKEIIL